MDVNLGSKIITYLSAIFGNGFQYSCIVVKNEKEIDYVFNKLKLNQDEILYRKDHLLDDIEEYGFAYVTFDRDYHIWYTDCEENDYKFGPMINFSNHIVVTMEEFKKCVETRTQSKRLDI